MIAISATAWEFYKDSPRSSSAQYNIARFSFAVSLFCTREALFILKNWPRLHRIVAPIDILPNTFGSATTNIDKLPVRKFSRLKKPVFAI